MSGREFLIPPIAPIATIHLEFALNGSMNTDVDSSTLP